MKIDTRITTEVENDSVANLACIIFGATMIAVEIGRASCRERV